MSRQCYKVVRNENGKLKSLLMFGKAEVTYVPHKPAVPPEFLRAKGYGLTVFTSPEHALEFLLLAFDPHGELWECTCAEITDRLPRPLDHDSLTVGQIQLGYIPWAKGTEMTS